MKIIVAGSRGFLKSELCFEKMDNYNSNGKITEIVSGGARGADTLGEDWAKARSIAIIRFIPDWDGQGKKAGILRNIEMGNYADGLVAFWDGNSRGTLHMITFMKNHGKLVRVVRYE